MPRKEQATSYLFNKLRDGGFFVSLLRPDKHEIIKDLHSMEVYQLLQDMGKIEYQDYWIKCLFLFKHPVLQEHKQLLLDACKGDYNRGIMMYYYDQTDLSQLGELSYKAHLLDRLCVFLSKQDFSEKVPLEYSSALRLYRDNKEVINMIFENTHIEKPLGIDSYMGTHFFEIDGVCKNFDHIPSEVIYSAVTYYLDFESVKTLGIAAENSPVLVAG